MGRSELREHIFKMVFGVEFNAEEELTAQLNLYLDQLEDVSEKDRDYMLNKAKAVIEKLAEIDALLNASAEGWKTSRMNKVDLTILRLAVYEMRWDEDVPVKVAINEAVELSKRFSGDGGPAFINGVLGKLAEA
ncbi:transcription antitermination factor NusB [Bariatricus massiliensis]|uniref:Transcription antitermination protein NusB n=1 Tax=Bariatricus massiliensis TaxID=1745713 RepID=A0ABS8DD45_9FIRM|nr:transcription antitermination factor NusB [Bariatricus massiliensis]MCB7303520.1 transcription antitermination factor NusB [Bariatricus massiliensis]MCB7373652.1 transcription antitermination factor NusB [Bariatricus massiliensis]MCB7386322.1 transcription antitermination factor NusB [Bariatricus massiliensis]MCB7410484.1 transcription antitermination factor NusB [Bariatricus massiliensis]MCQ5252232.1 transcription antitermination factor NusB [Bariatricus massiliensis]